MAKTALSLRLEEDTTARLDRIAHALDRSRSWVIADAIRLYLESEGKSIEAVLEAVAAADAGDIADEKEVRAVFGKYRRAAEAAE
jgi:RHH-type transcriptional regulator, rel operon repressor / antitoxin RelB